MNTQAPSPSLSTELILRDLNDGILTLTMNNPKRLNGWTMPMMDALKAAFRESAVDPAVKVVILTGAGTYYCAGVNLSATLKLGHPKKLHGMIVEHNQDLFDTFLEFPKPILIAINGHAIGASVTSATLCNGIIAAEGATFSTPFAALGICPEGCSSVHFAQLMGEDNAQRMLGKEGWKPSASEAKEAGLIEWVSSTESLIDDAKAIAHEWIERGETRAFRGSDLEELKAVNARESIALADAFLASPFLKAQVRFLWSKKKYGPAGMFGAMLVTRPLWSWLL
jgi:enoyl-CoA hydratase/carnithine racemase